MTYEALQTAITEAKRFLEKAEEVDQSFKKYPDQTWYHAPQFSLKSAACKRASMDLTRALAILRGGIKCH